MNKYPQLDLARSLAALFVFFNHLRYLSFLGYDKQNLGAAGKAFFFITGFGHQSVMVFFVLSGFFISKTIVDSIERGKWSPKRYAVHRVTRLWVVFIPALLLTLLMDTLTEKFFGFNDSEGRHTLINFLRNMFFMQGFHQWPAYGSNIALWSLANEFWYYVLLPFVLVPIFIPSSRKIAIPVALVVMFGAYWVLRDFFVGIHGFLIFLMGALVYCITRKETRKIKTFWFYLGVLFFLIVLTLSRYIDSPPALWDMLLGTGVAVMVYTWVMTKDQFSRYYDKYATFFSSFSFTLYVTHVPLMLFFCSMVGLHNAYVTPMNMVWYCLLAVGNLALSYGLYWLFERNTNHVRKYVESKLL